MTMKPVEVQQKNPEKIEVKKLPRAEEESVERMRKGREVLFSNAHHVR